MNFPNQTIAGRINALAGFLLLALILVSFQGWRALEVSADENANEATTTASYEQAVNAARVAQVSFKIQVQEWKNILLRGTSAEAFAKHAKGFRDMDAATRTALLELRNTETPLGLDVSPVDELLAAHEQLGRRYFAALEHYDATKPDSSHVVDALVKGMDRGLNDKIDAIVSATRAGMEKVRLAAASNAQRRLRVQTELLGVVVLVALGLGATATYYIKRSITVPLTRTIGYFSRIAQGNFDNSIEITRHDEIGEVLRALQVMQAKLGSDLTASNRLVTQVADVVQSAAQGDFSSRIETSGVGVFPTLGEGVNQLLGTTEAALAEVARVLSAFARGDLSQRITNSYAGTFSQLRDDANTTGEKLSAILHEVRGAVDALGSASSQVSATAQSLAHSASEQATSVDQTTASVRDLSASVLRNTENAQATTAMAAQSAREAVTGGTTVMQTVSAMKEIATKVGVVDDIAKQTNLLALNAAIQAAHAGEAGLAFAVVATEVRGLAARSAAAAREIGNLLEGSLSVSERAGATITTMVPTIRKTSDLVQDISRASAAQTTELQKIDVSMGTVNAATQRNASAAEELAATAEELSGHARQLQSLIGFFSLADGAAPKPGRRPSKRPPSAARPHLHS